MDNFDGRHVYLEEIQNNGAVALMRLLLVTSQADLFTLGVGFANNLLKCCELTGIVGDKTPVAI